MLNETVEINYVIVNVDRDTLKLNSRSELNFYRATEKHTDSIDLLTFANYFLRLL